MPSSDITDAGDQYPPSPSLSLIHPAPLLSSPIQNPGCWSAERRKLPLAGPGRSPSRDQIGCIFTLKSHIWWTRFYWELTVQIVIKFLKKSRRAKGGIAQYSP